MASISERIIESLGWALPRRLVVGALAAGFLAFGASPASAQFRGMQEAAVPASEVAEKGSGSSATIPLESAVSKDYTITIKGQRVPYRATAGTLPVYDPDGKAVAAVFYVRSEEHTSELQSRGHLVCL